METPAENAANHKSFDFTDINRPPRPNTNTETANDIPRLQAALADKLSPYAKNKSLPPEFNARIVGVQLKLKTFNDIGLLKNFYNISIKPLLVECERKLAKHMALTAEYRELYSHYFVLCEMLSVKPQVVPLTTQSLSELEEIMEDMEARFLYNAEKAYICDTIDTVMDEMGYKLLGWRHVTPKRGKRLKHKLYTFTEGIVINVTYTDNGQITMELGGLDYVDRMPNENEAAKLTTAIESFCHDFEEIETRLTKLGIVSESSTAFYATTPEYAVIINLSDYELTSEQKPVLFNAVSKQMA